MRSVKCEMCNGKGYYIDTSLSFNGYGIETDCPDCNGTGEQPENQEDRIRVAFEKIETDKFVATKLIPCAQTIDDYFDLVNMHREIIRKMDSAYLNKIKLLKADKITMAEEYQTALDKIHKDLECCGNCGNYYIEAGMCGYTANRPVCTTANKYCGNWKQRRK